MLLCPAHALVMGTLRGGGKSWPSPLGERRERAQASLPDAQPWLRSCACVWLAGALGLWGVKGRTWIPRAGGGSSAPGSAGHSWSRAAGPCIPLQESSRAYQPGAGTARQLLGAQANPARGPQHWARTATAREQPRPATQPQVTLGAPL